jgi:hypothetical protein
MDFGFLYGALRELAKLHDHEDAARLLRLEDDVWVMLQGIAAANVVPMQISPYMGAE